MPYTHQAYPKMVYANRDGEIVHEVVNSPRELEELGAGWAESPDGPFFTTKRETPKLRNKLKTKR